MKTNQEKVQERDKKNRFHFPNVSPFLGSPTDRPTDRPTPTYLPTHLHPYLHLLTHLHLPNVASTSPKNFSLIPDFFQ